MSNLRVVSIQFGPKYPSMKEEGQPKGEFFGYIVQQFNDEIFFIDEQGGRTDSGITKQDIKEYCQQAGATFEKRAIVEHFIDLLTEKKDLSEDEKKCFCDWLLVTRNIGSARKITFEPKMAHVRKNEVLKNSIQYIADKYPNQVTAEIVDSLKHWQPAFLEKLIALDILFLNRIFETTKPGKILSSLSVYSSELIEKLSKLDASFLDKIFETANPEDIIRGLDSYTPQLLEKLSKLDASFLDKIFNSSKATGILYSFRNYQPTLLERLATVDSRFLDSILEATNSVRIFSNLHGYQPELLEKLAQSPKVFLDSVLKAAAPERVIDYLREYEPGVLEKLAMLDSELLHKIFSANNVENLLAELKEWPSEKLDAFIKNPKILKKIILLEDPVAILAFFRYNSDDIFINFLSKIVQDEGSEEVADVWLKIINHPDRLEIKENLLRDPAIASKILVLEPHIQAIILFNILNESDGLFVFNFLYVQNLFGGDIPATQVKEILLHVHLRYVLPALQPVTNYFDLPKDFNFKPFFLQMLQIDPEQFLEIASYEAEVFKAIVRVVVDYLVEQDPALPKALQDEIEPLLIQSDPKDSHLYRDLMENKISGESAISKAQLAILKESSLQAMCNISIVLAKIQAHKNNQTLLLNHTKLFNDPDIDKWNNLKIRESISDGDWNALKMQLDDHLAIILPDANDREKRKNIMGFFTKAMDSSDAKASEAGRLQVRQQVASIIDPLLALPPGDRQVEDVIEMLNFGGEACSDRVIVVIDLAQMYIKFQLAGPEYKANVLANAFKKKNIERLVNPYQAENIETLLYYKINLNSIFQLGLPTETTMLYEGCAQKKPWIQVFPRLFFGFTADDFVSYVADNSFLQRDWKKSLEYDAMQASLKKSQEAAISEANASEEEITEYLTKELKFEEPTNEQIQHEMIRRQKEFFGLKTYILNEITKVYDKAGFVLRKPTDGKEIINEEEERAEFIEKKKAEEEQNITKWIKQLTAVTALEKALNALLGSIPDEGIDKNGFTALVEGNQALQDLIKLPDDTELQGSIGAFKALRDKLLSDPTKEKIFKNDFKIFSQFSLPNQKRTLTSHLSKTVEVYEKEIKALTEELNKAKATYENRSLTPEEELLYYGRSQQLANAIEIADREYFKKQAMDLALKGGYIIPASV